MEKSQLDCSIGINPITCLLFVGILLNGLILVPHSMAAESTPNMSKRSQKIAKLIEQLGHDEYSVREQAQQQLMDIGKVALPAIEKARHHTDFEIKNRAEAIWAQIQRVVITAEVDKNTYFIGEPFMVHIRFENVTDKPQKISLPQHKAYGLPHSKLKFSAIDAKGRSASRAVPKPAALQYGRFVEPVTLSPNQVYYRSYSPSSYLHFDHAGEYQLTVRLSYKGMFTTTIPITIRRPTPDQAMVLIKRLEQAPCKGSHGTGQKCDSLPKLATLRHPLYLKPLKEIQDSGVLTDYYALGGMGSIPTSEATEMLLDYWNTERGNAHKATFILICLNKRIPYLNQFKPGAPVKPSKSPIISHEEMVAMTWKTQYRDRLFKPMDEMIGNIKGNKKIGFFTLTQVLNRQGQKEQLPTLIKVLDGILRRNIDDNDYDFNSDERRSLIRLARQWITQPDVVVNKKPTTGGEIIIAALYFAQQRQQRPKEWVTQYIQWLKHDNPIVQHQVLKCLPFDAPHSLGKHIAPLIGSSHEGIPFSALRAATLLIHKDFKVAILNLLAEEDPDIHRSLLCKAALHHSIKRDKIMMYLLNKDHFSSSTVSDLFRCTTDSQSVRCRRLSKRPDKKTMEQLRQSWIKFVEQNEENWKQNIPIRFNNPKINELLLAHNPFFKIEAGGKPVKIIQEK